MKAALVLAAEFRAKQLTMDSGEAMRWADRQGYTPEEIEALFDYRLGLLPP